jgi:phosphate transport system substrate-binding protein
MPSEPSFRDRSYPLVRNIYIYFDRPPGRPMEPKLKEFLRFALSQEGQQMVGDADYLPLPAESVRDQLKKLD